MQIIMLCLFTILFACPNVYRFLLLPFCRLLICFCAVATEKKHTYINIYSKLEIACKTIIKLHTINCLLYKKYYKSKKRHAQRRVSISAEVIKTLIKNLT